MEYLICLMLFGKYRVDHLNISTQITLKNVMAGREPTQDDLQLHLRLIFKVFPGQQVLFLNGNLFFLDISFPIYFFELSFDRNNHCNFS